MLKVFEKAKINKIRWLVTFETKDQKESFDRFVDKANGVKRCKSFATFEFDNEPGNRIPCSGVYGRDTGKLKKWLLDNRKAYDKLYYIG